MRRPALHPTHRAPSARGDLPSDKGRSGKKLGSLVTPLEWQAWRSRAPSAIVMLIHGQTSESGAHLGQSQSTRNWRARPLQARRQPLHDRSAGDVRAPRAGRNRDRRGQGRIHHRARRRISRARLYRRRAVRNHHARAGGSMRPRRPRQSARRADGRAHAGQPDAAPTPASARSTSTFPTRGRRSATSSIGCSRRRSPPACFARSSRARSPTSRPTCAIMRAEIFPMMHAAGFIRAVEAAPGAERTGFARKYVAAGKPVYAASFRPSARVQKRLSPPACRHAAPIAARGADCNGGHRCLTFFASPDETIAVDIGGSCPAACGRLQSAPEALRRRLLRAGAAQFRAPRIQGRDRKLSARDRQISRSARTPKTPR